MSFRYFQCCVSYLRFLVIGGGITLFLASGATAQSSRPRRVQPKQETQKQDSLLLPQPTPTPAPRNSNVPLLDIKPVKPVAASSAPLDTGTTATPDASD